jgi:glutamine amidotransferase
MRITIIEYGMGNIKSVANAFMEVGAEVTVCSTSEEIKRADVLVLPGVGAFKKGMENLHKLNLVDVLHQEVRENRKPFLGICLGMQLIAMEGYEHGKTPGFGWIPGQVVEIQPVEKKYRVPHIGWNDLQILSEDSILFNGLGSNPVCYFVHSYYLKVQEDRKDIITATCWHGEELTASVQLDNILGVQFHPEKSQRAGVKILDNFVRFVRQAHHG